jgi:hypothetical protein
MADPEYEAISKAKRQTESNNVSGAISTLESYLEVSPSSVKARIALARTLIYDAKEIDKGIEQLNFILEADADNIDALKASVTVLIKDKKNNKEVSEKYERLLVLEPSAEVYNSYARFLRQQKLDFKRSAEFYEKAISAAPSKYEYHQNYAVLLLNDIKDYQKAKEELEIVLKLNPGNASAKKNYDLLMKKKFDADGNVKKGRFSAFKKNI